MTRDRVIGAFPALAIPNYRRYLSGQSISLAGTWMQMTAQAWLVLTLSDSPSALGVVVALQTLPVLLLGPYGGVIADRVNKLRLMISLQTVMGVQALVLGVLTVTGEVRLWHVGVLAAVLGLNNAFESPARQSFMLEMVGRDSLRTAISLNSTMVNLARVVGPAIGGLIIAGAGVGVCFLINAASFVVVVWTLLHLDRSAIAPSTPIARAKGQLREGLRYVARTPELGIPLLMMALAGVFAFEFQVTLPVLAREALDQGSEGFGLMTAAMGLGAVGGGLLVAARGKTGLRPLSISAAWFGVVLLLAALAPNLPLALIALVLVGWGSVSFMATGNTTLQLAAAPEMRGRVMSLWFVAFQGSTPIGGPILGWAMGWAGARIGLGAGGVACFVVAAIGLLAIAAIRRRAEEDATARLDLHSRACVPSPSANGRSSSPTIPTRPRAQERSSSASVPPG
jgi:MFS family permease